MPNTPKLERSVRRINKKTVYIFLAIFLLTFFLVLVKVLANESRQRSKEEAKLDARATSDQEFLQMLESIPSSYDEVEQPQNPTPIEPVVEEAPRQLNTQASGARHYVPREDGPWAQAEKAERARAAEEYWISRRANNDVEVIQYHTDSASGSNGLKSRSEVKLENSSSPYSLSEGTIIPAILLSKIVSELPGPILAQVSDNIFDSKLGKYLLIPQGTKLVGEYISTTSHGQNRAQIKWSRMILPNQKSVNLDSMVGVDESGTSGVGGSVDNHYGELFVGLLATSLLSSALSPTQSPSNTATPQANIGSAVGQDVAQFGAKVAEKNLNIKPTITVESGSKISVFATKQFVLEPYSF